MDDDEVELPAFIIPEWIVTFGDMMALLMTFFIMLVSMSEIKHENKYQAMVDSMREQFGYQRSIASVSPGEHRPRESRLNVLSTTGRAPQRATARGGAPEKAPQGEEPMVRIIRPGKMTAVGTVIYFPVAETTLDAQAKRDLDLVAQLLRGKPQRIEVRGHTTAELAARTGGSLQSMTLGYQRALETMRYLVDVQGLPAERFRIASAGANELTPIGTALSGHERPRVEVFLLDEATDMPGNEADSRK